MRFLYVGVALIAFASPAKADSDGMSCIGSGYLAVEFRSFSTPSLAGTHVLKIARFDDPLGPRWTGEVIVEDFQPWRLTCGAEQVSFEGWGEPTGGLVFYVVGLNPEGVPRVLYHTNDPAFVFRPQYGETLNVGNWSKSGITALPSMSTDRNFRLNITKKSVPQPQAKNIRWDNRTVLEEVDAAGNVTRSLLLFSGSFLESID
jgi:hypothetical protein